MKKNHNQLLLAFCDHSTTYLVLPPFLVYGSQMPAEGRWWVRAARSLGGGCEGSTCAWWCWLAQWRTLVPDTQWIPYRHCTAHGCHQLPWEPYGQILGHTRHRIRKNRIITCLFSFKYPKYASLSSSPRGRYCVSFLTSYSLYWMQCSITQDCYNRTLTTLEHSTQLLTVHHQIPARMPKSSCYQQLACRWHSTYWNYARPSAGICSQKTLTTLFSKLLWLIITMNVFGGESQPLVGEAVNVSVCAWRVTTELGSHLLRLVICLRTCRMAFLSCMCRFLLSPRCQSRNIVNRIGTPPWPITRAELLSD